jgi:uncharacterized protein YbbC (DUF1343 family)
MPAKPVITGIDALVSTQFVALHGLRLGLVTNHTGLDSEGRATVDLLHHAPGVDLRVLFSPEHGIRGLLDEAVHDGRDSRTGLPVYSLYGERTRPSAAQLADLDALVYDIQDIGARFYTYSSTLGLVMEEAARHGLAYYVLDRPNPLGGIEVEGPLADPDKLSFTAYHTVPVRHGLTVGELAALYNGEKGIGAKLQVIQMQNWKRSTMWDGTGLTWVNPSPNMRSFTESLLYPGICLLEATNVSVGRGTDTPFELVGAPWIEARALAESLNHRRLPGVRFIPVRFTPKSSVHAGAECGGINIVITSQRSFLPVLTGMAIGDTLLRLYRDHWTYSQFDRLLVNRAAYDAFMRGERAEEIVHSWGSQIHSFKSRRAPYLLYS